MHYIQSPWKKNLSYIILSYSRLEKVFSYCIITAELLVIFDFRANNSVEKSWGYSQCTRNCPINTRSTFFWTEFTVKKYNTCLVPTESSIEKLYNNHNIKERFFSELYDIYLFKGKFKLLFYNKRTEIFIFNWILTRNIGLLYFWQKELFLW